MESTDCLLMNSLKTILPSDARLVYADDVHPAEDCDSDNSVDNDFLSLQ